jgi:hypothetical protein
MARELSREEDYWQRWQSLVVSAPTNRRVEHRPKPGRSIRQFVAFWGDIEVKELLSRH